jgi:hypothetical protein
MSVINVVLRVSRRSRAGRVAKRQSPVAGGAAAARSGAALASAPRSRYRHRDGHAAPVRLARRRTGQHRPGQPERGDRSKGQSRQTPLRQATRRSDSKCATMDECLRLASVRETF